jgi:lipoate---protein ligase
MEKIMENGIDEDLLSLVKEQGGAHYRLWEPASPLVVLGRSSHPEEEVLCQACRQDGIPVLKRSGGGKSVLLSPGMLIISLALETIHFRGHLYYAKEINRIIEKTLTFCGVRNISFKGISDLALGDRKILGCCLYLTRVKERWIVFYQASLLCHADLRLMTRYLEHPPWEPDYRKGRPHEEFLTTLWAQGHRLQIMQVASRLALGFEQTLPSIS